MLLAVRASKLISWNYSKTTYLIYHLSLSITVLQILEQTKGQECGKPGYRSPQTFCCGLFIKSKHNYRY